MKRKKLTALFITAMLIILSLGTTATPASAAGDPAWMSLSKEEITMFKEYQAAFSSGNLLDGRYHCRVFTFTLPENGDVTINLEETRHESLFFSNIVFEFYNETDLSTPVLTWQELDASLNASGESYLGSASGYLNAGKYYLLMKIDDHYYQQAQGYTFLFNFDFVPRIDAPLIKTAKPLKKKIQVKWNLDATATAYELQYSTKKDFRPTATKTVMLSSPTKGSYTIKKLKKKKTYYIRLRAIHNISFFIVGEKPFISPWSVTQHTKTK